MLQGEKCLNKGCKGIPAVRLATQIGGSKGSILNQPCEQDLSVMGQV